MSFPPITDTAELEHRRAVHMIEAAPRAKVSHIVFTGFATFADRPLPGSEAKHRIEESIRDSGIDHALLRPVRFMENYLFLDAPHDGIRDGVNRHVFLPDHPMKIIAVDDVGRMAALAFAAPGRYRGRALEPAGDDPTPTDAADLAGKSVGKPVTYERLSRAEASAGHPHVGAIDRMLDEADTNGWHASPDMLRRHRPNAKRLADSLRDGGAARIKDFRRTADPYPLSG